ncbi:MAG: YbaB/EbfC family nucleoid-associated protein [Phenylobacterium sp.]|uniref:YbaB/EbfC family nucleoid-associated protein n=1 Tax=Phenylobacterium sp. TaxID=1871053 RepID=UPI0025E354BE|nr:YbaB/EbfC family nucleoid-associated protein [Phenylobacterium sp.]MBI1199950.1 YbaB/EbfC family nucleoid-associated protein [Phenylobacterium sp.]
MKDLNSLMKQAQVMQQRMAEAQEKIQALEVEGTSGGGMVKLTLAGTGELRRVVLDPSLMAPGEEEVVADLVVAAHADAKRKLDEKQGELMREAAGPLAGLNIPGMPKF